MSRLIRYGLMCATCALLGLGCGGDDTPSSATMTGGDLFNTTGGSTIAGSLGGAGGTIAAATGGSTTTTTGGAASTGGFQAATCDTTVVAATSCGGETCTAPSGFQATNQCAISCCADDGSGNQVCGTQNAIQGNVSTCTPPPPPPEPDPLCPSGTDRQGNPAQGCCTQDNSGNDVCGLITTSGFTGNTTCRVSGGFGGFGGGGGGGGTTYPCDGSGLNPDAGTDNDAGM